VNDISRRLDPLRQMESELLLPARTLELGPEGREDWVVLDALMRQALLIAELDNGLSVGRSLECLVKAVELRYAENCLVGILLVMIILRLAGLWIVDFFNAVFARHNQICVLCHRGLEDAGFPRGLIAKVLSSEPFRPSGVVVCYEW
jgi:hypothetical protein